VGEHGLVGGDEGLVGLEGGAGQRESGAIGAADKFHHDIDIVAAGERGGVILPGEAGEIDAAFAAAVASRDGGDGDGPAGAAGVQF
jgi:hypothetical protein